MKKINIDKDTILLDENLSYEKFLEENQKFFVENVCKESYKKIPNVSNTNIY